MELLNQMPKHNLFGLEKQDYGTAKIAVLPIPYDSTLTYRAGAREGPRAIIEASRNIELYSYELGRSLENLGIYTLDELAPDLSSPEKAISSISKEIGIIINDKKVPLLLGGEHTIALGSLSALNAIGADLTLVQLDAHADMYDELNGTKYSHACVMARAKELFSDVFQVGIRNIDEKSAKQIGNGRLFLIDDAKEIGFKELGRLINKKSKKNLYVTLDFDVLDPSEMPSIGTPEPNGMHFSDVIEFIKELSKGKRLAGADFTELSPIPGFVAPDYLAAKLIYLFLGYFYRDD
ncbi:MAG: agmatinase [Candidatus Micrarchaeaceae archaeon]